jgi:hypothetical protein
MLVCRMPACPRAGPSRVGRPNRAKTYGKKREHGPNSCESSPKTLDALLSRHEAAVYCVQSAMDGMSTPGPAYCTQQTGGLTRRMTLRAIQATKGIARRNTPPNRPTPPQHEIACKTLAYDFARLGLPPRFECIDVANVPRGHLATRLYAECRCYKRRDPAASHWAHHTQRERSGRLVVSR